MNDALPHSLACNGYAMPWTGAAKTGSSGAAWSQNHRPAHQALQHGVPRVCARDGAHGTAAASPKKIQLRPPLFAQPLGGPLLPTPSKPFKRGQF
jgi:hypothetical protein